MHLWAWTLMPILVGGAPPRSASFSLDLDRSMIPTCRKVLAGDPQAVAELASHPTVRLLSEGMRPGVIFTPREFADASRGATDDPRFSWKQLRERGDDVERLSSWIEGNENSLRSRSAKDATRFIAALPPSTRITEFALRVMLLQPVPPTIAAIGPRNRNGLGYATWTFSVLTTSPLGSVWLSGVTVMLASGTVSDSPLASR